jgi:hypothetical protein
MRPVQIQSCVAENGAATLPSECCAGLYLNGTHCCQKGWEWDPVYLTCIEQDPCYRSGSYSDWCIYRAPNCLASLGCTAGPQPLWWGTPFNAYCVIDELSPQPDMACCFVGAGLFGWVDSADEFYYWHEEQEIVVY